MFHKLNQVGETKKKQMKENQKQGELTDEPSPAGISSHDRAWWSREVFFYPAMAEMVKGYRGAREMEDLAADKGRSRMWLGFRDSVCPP